MDIIALQDIEELEVSSEIKALLCIRWGLPIPVDVHAQCLEDGIDVSVLEEVYM
jgi:hypothetical protein